MISDSIKGMVDAIKAIDVDWKIHLDAEINIEGMDIKVTFDKPADGK
jgi:hypothetical protein